MKRSKPISLWFSLLLLFFVACNNQTEIELTNNGKSLYKIVVAQDADSNELKAAIELQKYVERISDAWIPIIDDITIESDREILIGKTNRQASTKTSVESGKEDGFKIWTDGLKVVVNGNGTMGTLYGVYDFLENQLGCRKFSAKVSVVPRSTSIEIPELNISKEPAFNYRELHFPDPRNNEDYLNWHKLDLKKGPNEWGMFVHTFQNLVPVEKYFEIHPEYFSLLNVKRIPDGQLCLSNEDVYQIILNGLMNRMKEKPEALYWSVSQNDTYKPCECDGCQKLYDDYGGYSGAMVWFVNRFADEFPEKVISTLAYQYTRSGPENIQPKDNVNIMFCSIECNRSRPIPKDSLSASFRKDTEDWCKLTSNIFMWDYVVQFRNLLSPFPNLRVLQPCRAWWQLV